MLDAHTLIHDFHGLKINLLKSKFEFPVVADPSTVEQ